jgi:hypothetical protein
MPDRRCRIGTAPATSRWPLGKQNAEVYVTNRNQGSSGKVASNPARPADREGGANASTKQPTHSAPANDGRHGSKHAGHDLDSGQHSTSGSRSR